MGRQAQKQETRARMVELAARRLRGEGFQGNAVHRLMKDLGLTHGGFYVHFPSRDALDAAAMEVAMAEQSRLDARIPSDLPLAERRVARARRYLSRQHRDAPESGCAIAALLGEAARGGPELRARFEAEVRAVADTGADQGQELALLALAAGGLALARAVPDQALSNRILESCRDAVVRLAKSYEGDPA
jgi:TetR/AcrR family transcriptional repressor of nem operon